MLRRIKPCLLIRIRLRILLNWQYSTYALRYLTLPAWHYGESASKSLSNWSTVSNWLKRDDIDGSYGSDQSSHSLCNHQWQSSDRWAVKCPGPLKVRYKLWWDQLDSHAVINRIPTRPWWTYSVCGKSKTKQFLHLWSSYLKVQWFYVK